MNWLASQPADRLRPLTRRRSGGEIYTRRDDIEKALHHLNTLDRAAFLERIETHDRRDSHYVPSECLMYVLRETAIHDRAICDRVIHELLYRVGLNLKWAIKAGALRDEAGIREEILSEFSLMISQALAEAPDRLDFYEVAFDQALAAFRRSRFSKESLRQHREQSFDPLPPSTDGEGDAWILMIASEDTSEIQGLVGMEYEIFRNSILNAIIKLPDVEREAILLRLDGWPISSQEPHMNSIAKHCGVDERTIRNRIKSGVRKLQQMSQPRS